MRKKHVLTKHLKRFLLNANAKTYKIPVSKKAYMEKDAQTIIS